MSDDPKSAIVTGGARGIGLAVTRSLTKRGTRVIVLDKDVSTITADDTIEAVQLDVTDAEAIGGFFARLNGTGRSVRYLINNAGGSIPAELESMELRDWDATLALNLRSAFLMTTGVLAAMRRAGGGSIVNVSSIAAHSTSSIGGAAYAVAKAGLLALTRQTALEWGKYGIRANAVCPGPTRTQMTRESRRPSESFPLGRWIEPAHVADAILFLASQAADACTGSILDVDGGISL